MGAALFIINKASPQFENVAGLQGLSTAPTNYADMV